MVPIGNSVTTSVAIITIPANGFFQGYLTAVTAGLVAGFSTITLQGGGTGATAASGTVLLACGQGLQICTPVIRIWAGNASATLQFNLNGLTSARGGVVGFTDEA